MHQNSRLRAVRRGALLILRERRDACLQWLLNIWSLWLARAEAWQAWKEHDEQQALLEPNETLLASEPFAYEDYLRVLESARINRSARRLGIRIPDEFFQTTEIALDGSHRTCLTDQGLTEIIPRIQEESRKRRQEFGYWVGLTIGLLGALTGLVSVLR